MYLMQIDETRGINLDYLLEWYEMPPTLGTTPPPAIAGPALVLVMAAASDTTQGVRMPYEISLYGEKRLAMLNWLTMQAKPLPPAPEAPSAR